MTDINKQIEEESEMIAREGVENLLSEKNYIDKMKLHSAIKMTYKMGYKSALHSSRWRKVSEELPELGIEVIITRNDGIRFLAWLDKDFELFFIVSGNEEYFLDEIQSWKPID